MPGFYGRKLACSIDHPSVVKVNVVHAKTMEVYRCGGMDIGGMLKEMLKYHNNQNKSLNSLKLLRRGKLDFESH